MKKTIIMLLIACGVSMAANSAEINAPAKKPNTLIKALNALFDKCGDKTTVSTRENIDPNTGILKERYIVRKITVNAGDELLKKTIEAFEKDKDCGYQYIHIAPHDKQNEVIGTDGGKLVLREKIEEEMWMLNAKNPDNPALRDGYTLVLDNGTGVRKGRIFIITSLRPDLKSDEKPKSSGSISYPKDSSGANEDLYKAGNDSTGVKNSGNNMTRERKLSMSLNNYKYLIEQIGNQIETIRRGITRGTDDEKKAQKQIDDLQEQIKTITAKMQALLDKYVEDIDE